MIYVYVWLPTENAWGHCSMYIERGDPSESRYVSWWPLNFTNVNVVESNVADEKTYAEDVRLEGGPQTRCFMLNLGHPHLAEMPMVRAWDRWKRTRVYYTFNRNCCTTVAYLLREPGGALSYSSWEPATWWGPNDIVDYMGWLNRHFTVCEPLAPPVPPNMT